MPSGSPEISAENNQTNQHQHDSSQSFLTRRVKAVISNDKLFEGLSRDQLEYFSHLLESKPQSSRRNLKSVLESALVDVHAKFIAEYEDNVAGAVAAKFADLERLEDQISMSVEKLTISRERMGTAIDEGVNASAELGDVERKLDLISQFHDLFVIDHHESTVLPEDLNSILTLVESIEKKRQNCQSLLKAVPNARQAIDSLNRSVEILDSLYEKTFFTLIKLQPQTEAFLIRKSLIFLQDRPNLFHDSLSSLCAARRDSLSASLLHVLTRDEDGLELNSFDSVRFVSDLLSWFLDAVVSEKDWLDSIVDPINERLWSNAPVLPRVDYLDSILAGVEEMIESRFSSAVNSTFGILDLFKMSRIVKFYAKKLEPITGVSTKSVLDSMAQSALANFESLWDRRISEPVASLSTTGLAPPPIVTETVFLIESLLAIHAGVEDIPDEDSLFAILSSGIDPLVQLCVKTSKSAGMSVIESAVFLINCLGVLQGPLKKYRDFPTTQAWVMNLDTLIVDQMEILVNETRETVLKNTGLETFIASKTVPDLHPIALSMSVKNFYSLLFTQGISAISHTDSLIIKDSRTEARRAIGTAIADAYDELYNSVNHLGVTTHTPAQVRALLDV